MFITSYYFRAHMYTLVPHHVREDMEWMAAHGTDAVSIGVLEQDLTAAQENIAIIGAEAERAGLKLFVTPSRWGSLVAGSPKVPSIFACRHPQACMQNADGSPLIGFLGPLASVHHPATFDFFCESLQRLFELTPIAGVIWDEPKALEVRDFSPAARTALKDRNIEAIETHIDAFAGFLDRVGAEALKMQSQLRLCMFVFGHIQGYSVERCAAMGNLHDFGCDGRPFRREDSGSNDSGRKPAVKLLCEQGPYFIEQARKNGKRPLLLIENHAMLDADVEIMDKRLPEVLSLGAEHLLYYYYPRGLTNPDRNMSVLGKHLKTAKT